MFTCIPQQDSRKKGSMLSISSVDVKVDDDFIPSLTRIEEKLEAACLELTALEIEASNRYERKRLERSKHHHCDFEEFLNNRQKSEHFTDSSVNGVSSQNDRRSANQKTRRNAEHVGVSNETKSGNTTADQDVVQYSAQFRERRGATCDAVDETHTRRTRQRIMRKRLTLREIEQQSV